MSGQFITCSVMDSPDFMGFDSCYDPVNGLMVLEMHSATNTCTV